MGYYVHNHENKQPYDVDKMPVNTNGADNRWLWVVKVAQKSQAGNNANNNKTDNNMQAMKTSQGKKACTEHAAADVDILIE